MATRKSLWLGSVALLALTALLPATGRAATEAQKVAAIDNGLAYLYSHQQASGAWTGLGYDDASTAASVSAFLSQKTNWGANAANYQAAVDKGIAFLLADATTSTVGDRTDGKNPCGAPGSTCGGVYWYGSGEATYTTGLVASALGQYALANPGAVATASGPLAGMTYTQIAQGITNQYAAYQSTSVNQTYPGARGGWRYFAGQGGDVGDADGSTTQWAVISMIYDQALGATTPQFVKDELKNNFLNFDQRGDGAGCYQGPGSGICENSDTGALLIDHAFVGDGKSNAQVQAALAFLNSQWTQTANNTWNGEFGQPYAMWATYKGLELQLGLGDNSAITNLFTNCAEGQPGNPPGSTACNWWQDMNDWLVANQAGNGSWGGYAYWPDPLSTAWDVSILGGTVIPPQPTGAPEPATLSLLGVGLAAVGLLRRRRASN